MKYHPPKIQNETDLDGRIVGGIIRYVFRHLDLYGKGTLVKVKYHTKRSFAYQGRCYYNPRATRGYVYDHAWGMYKEIRPNVPPDTRHLLVVRIAKPDVYPVSNHVYDRKDSPGPWMIEDWQRSLVAITAHEGWHLLQYKIRHGHGRFNEVDTEWAAKRIHDAWVEDRC